MIDYAMKGVLIKSGLVKYEREISYNAYKTGDNNEYLEIGQRITEKAKILNPEFFDSFIPVNPWFECHKINKATYKRNYNLRQRIENMLIKGQCIFLTLTFTDDTLNKTSQKTRRKYVTNYLKSQSDYYVANIDYGSKNGREHYHAVILKDKVDFKNWRKYGNVNGEKIRIKTATDLKLAKYISKLTNHAIKNTNKRQVIIYSKKGL